MRSGWTPMRSALIVLSVISLSVHFANAALFGAHTDWWPIGIPFSLFVLGVTLYLIVRDEGTNK